MIDEDLPPEPRKVTLTLKTARNFAIVLVVAAGAAAAVTIGVALLLVNIFERKQEARSPYFEVAAIDDDTADPAIWGRNFPQQYDGYLRTVDSERTKFGGSEALPRTPTPEDPRVTVTQSELEADPRLVSMWAGYAFSRDYRRKRGHAYMLEDQTFTERQRVAQQPGTCLNCHASTYVVYKKLGDGDLFKGFDALNKMTYVQARDYIKEQKLEHPVACIDCHDPENMPTLRITRPAFIAGIRAAKKQEGLPDYDVNRDASRQEMRAYVCGQCHVEYYFQGPEKRLVYPWSERQADEPWTAGLRGDNILAYYDKTDPQFKDWTHAATGAPCLKAQHPEFETWNQGIHARSGVACADCHMPYMRVGAQKISDHNVRSPLLNIAGSCQTCHRFPEEEILARAELIQAKTTEMSDRALDALIDLIAAIGKAKTAGADDAALAKPREFQRKAEFLIDFVLAENSTGFHAPQECARLLLTSLDYSRQGIQALATPPVVAASTEPAE